MHYLILPMIWLVIGGIGVPLPEDGALLAIGALVYHGAVPWEIALAAAVLGVLAGDVTLFLLARRAGPKFLEHRWLRRLLPPERSARIEALYQRRGGWIVFLARHVAGLRAATFVMAGVHRMRPRTFIAWDGLAACVSVPLMVGLGYAGALHLDRVRADIALVERYVLLAIGIGVLGWLLLRRSRRSRVSNGASVSKRNASAVVR